MNMDLLNSTNTSHNLVDCTNSSQGSLMIFFGVILTLSGTFVILCNAWILTALSLNRTLIPRGKPLVISLAIADIVYGISFTSSVFSGIHWLWMALQMLNILGHWASVTHLVAIGVERLLSLMFPFKYHIIMTWQTHALMVASPWALSICANIWLHLSSADPGTLRASVIAEWIIFCVICILMALIYSKIACIMSDLQGRMAELNPEAVQNHRVTRMLARVLGIFLILWAPYHLFRLILLVAPAWINPCDFAITTFILEILTLANSAANIFIYASVNRKFIVTVTNSVKRSTSLSRVTDYTQ